MATHSSILAWRIPGTGNLAGGRLWVAQSRTRLKQLSSSSNNEETEAYNYFLDIFNSISRLLVPNNSLHITRIHKTVLHMLKFCLISA